MTALAAIGEGGLGGVSVSLAVDCTSTSLSLVHLAASFEVRVLTSRKDIECVDEVVEVSKSMVFDSSVSGTTDGTADDKGSLYEETVGVATLLVPDVPDMSG